jgi:molecular chaperone HscA
MLLESLQHAKEDIAQRALLEAKTEAEQLIEQTTRFVEKNNLHLFQEEIEQTSKAIAVLKATITANNKDKIQQQIEALNEISRPYAERLMDTAIATAMKGKKI